MSDFHRDDDAHDFTPSAADDWRDGCAPALQSPGTGEFDLARFIDALPGLGPVLWIDRRARKTQPSRAAIGTHGVLLIDHPALATLPRCRELTAHSAVTSHGPREWLCLRDGDGAMLAKLFLLPDTDYLAWDEMIAAGRPAAPAVDVDARTPKATFLRGAFARIGAGWRARLIVFDLKRLPWLRTLDAHAPLRISLLGLELARVIARAENADLVAPLRFA